MDEQKKNKKTSKRWSQCWDGLYLEEQRQANADKDESNTGLPATSNKTPTELHQIDEGKSSTTLKK